MADANNTHGITWPENKSFAFTVFDDTDFATVENAREVYALLLDLGILVTKSVWPLEGPEESSWWGATCADQAYLDWVCELKSKGIEIGFHNASYESSERPRVAEGIDRFESLFGSPPRSYACHAQCRENTYWGVDRVSGINRLAYNMSRCFRRGAGYEGHKDHSPWFWGDICQSKITYVRNFVFSGINTLAACPIMPYRDRDRPYVNQWFASSNGEDCDAFVRCLSESNQDLLEEQGGACIMYTHFGWGFHRDGALNPRFKELMERLSRKNGWFVPVSTLLDHLLKVKGNHIITRTERNGLERKWLADRARVRLKDGLRRLKRSSG
jgi:hypothetical protein